MAYSTTIILLLVALRVATGWYFFESGRSKNLDRDFSSAGFLSQAKGPLAGLFKAPLPDHHDFALTMDVPLEERPKAHPPGSDLWKTEAERPYEAWLESITIDFGRTKERIATHYSFDDAQDHQGRRIFAYHEGRLRDFLADNSEDLSSYRHELGRLFSWQQAETSEAVPFEAERIATKQKELAAQAATFKAGVAAIEQEFRAELAELATSGQRAERGRATAEGSSLLAGFDRFITVTHFLIGACLVVGFLTRIAAFGGGLFLLLVIVSQPPWVVGYSAIGYQIEMMLICLLLMATGAGRWCGLDYFVRKICKGCCCCSKSASKQNSKNQTLNPA